MKDKWTSECGTVTLYLGDCLEILPTLAPGSVDAVVTDPPYAEINRKYGRLTEGQWKTLMDSVVLESKRILTSSGSAAYILQHNMKTIGSMRHWLYRFQYECATTWNIVQDLYWWNSTALPSAGTRRTERLCRASVKPIVWCGPPDCFRNQDAVLLPISEWARDRVATASDELKRKPSGSTTRDGRMYRTAIERGGSTPFNLLNVPVTGATNDAGVHGHGAGTPLPVAEWLVKYLAPAGGSVLDCFCGSGTMGVAAVKHGMRFIGIEKEPDYFATSVSRIQDELKKVAFLEPKPRGVHQRTLLDE